MPSLCFPFPPLACLLNLDLISPYSASLTKLLCAQGSAPACRPMSPCCSLMCLTLWPLSVPLVMPGPSCRAARASKHASADLLERFVLLSWHSGCCTLSLMGRRSRKLCFLLEVFFPFLLFISLLSIEISLDGKSEKQGNKTLCCSSKAQQYPGYSKELSAEV